MVRLYLILAVAGLLLIETGSLAQTTDSLKTRAQMLVHENDRYIRMALQDGVISTVQSDSLRRVNAGVNEKPLQVITDIVFQLRDFLDAKYEQLMKIVNDPILEEHYYSAKSMLPSKLGLPKDYISPEEREYARQKLAMEQFAESLANDFEREKLPKWQIWWHKHIRLFLGNRDWFNGDIIYVNGHEVSVPRRGK